LSPVSLWPSPRDLIHRIAFAGREEEVFFEAVLAGVKVVVAAALRE
jgi:hypothetical protein